MRAVSGRHRHTARRRHRPGQAMLEVALALPFVLVLLAGATQVGAIAYGMVSADTAVREAGRIGQQSPHDSLDPVAASGGQHVCSSTDPAVETNPICIAAYQSAGLLDRTKMVVTITLRGSSLLSWRPPPPGDVVQAGSNPNSPCNGAQARVTGTVTGLPAGQEASVSSTTGGSPVTTNSGLYTLCASPGTGVLSANLLSGGCTYSAALTGLTLVKNTQYVDDLSLAQSCPTTTTSSTTSTSSTSASTSTVTQSTTSAGGFSCSQTVTYPAFFTVTVSYPVSIFVPFVNGLFADHGTGGVRTVTSTVTEEIAPCGVTDNH